MRFKTGKSYVHELGHVGFIVGKMNSLIAGKGMVMELFIDGGKPTLQPVGCEEKHAKGWTPITRGEFIRRVNDINKERIEEKLTEVKADNCMRDIAKRDKDDLHLTLTLTCGHELKFSAKDDEPGKNAKFRCKECAEQTEMIVKKLQASLEE